MDIKNIFKKKEKNKLLINWKVADKLQKDNISDLFEKCSKHMPPYWDELKKDFDLGKTVKADIDNQFCYKENGRSRLNASTCPSFIEIFKNSYLLKAPVEFYVEINDNGIEIQSSNQAILNVNSHDLEAQLWGNFNPNVMNIKFELFDVAVKTLNKSTKIVILDNIFYTDIPFRVLPGVLPLSPKYPLSFNLNTTIDKRLISQGKKYTKLVKAGTPLAMFYMPDGVLDISCEEIDFSYKKAFIGDYIKKLNEN